MSLVKAIIKPEVGGQIEVMFNPKELSLNKQVKWGEQESAGQDASTKHYTSSEGSTLSFELFFDRYEQQASVHGDVAALLKLAHVVGEKHRPPVVNFVWGDINFQGVFSKMDVRFTMFLSDGKPCRATVSCSLKEFVKEGDVGKTDPLQSPDHAKMRRLKRGETLHSIAATEYDDPDEWRRIADANGIDNPLDLTPGTELLIPPIIPS